METLRMSQLGLSSSSSTRVAPTYTTGTSFVPAPWSANCRSHRVGSGSVSRAEGDGRPLYRRYARAPRLPSRPLGSLTQRAQESGGCSGSGSGRAGQGAAFPVEYRTPCSLCNDTKPRPQTRRGGVSRVQTLPCADCSGSGVPRGVACRLVVALIHTNVHPLDSGRARERVPSHRGRVRPDNINPSFFRAGAQPAPPQQPPTTAPSGRMQRFCHPTPLFPNPPRPNR